MKKSPEIDSSPLNPSSTDACTHFITHMPDEHANPRNASHTPAIAMLFQIPEILPHLLPGTRLRVMFSQASKLTRQMVKDGKLEITVRIKSRQSITVDVSYDLNSST